MTPLVCVCAYKFFSKNTKHIHTAAADAAALAEKRKLKSQVIIISSKV